MYYKLNYIYVFNLSCLTDYSIFYYTFISCMGMYIVLLFQMEIVKRLSTIIGQILPFLSQEHQQQIANTVERAKQVTVNDLGGVVGVSNKQTMCKLFSEYFLNFPRAIWRIFFYFGDYFITVTVYGFRC